MTGGRRAFGRSRCYIGGNINATIRDKFYGSASATPARVFPLLQRGAQEHLGKVRKTKPGLSVWFDREIAEIVGGLASGEFPRTLRLDEQGQFAIGFYHEREALYRSKGDAPLAGADTATSDTTDIQE